MTVLYSAGAQPAPHQNVRPNVKISLPHSLSLYLYQPDHCVLCYLMVVRVELANFLAEIFFVFFLLKLAKNAPKGQRAPQQQQERTRHVVIWVTVDRILRQDSITAGPAGPPNS